MSLQQTFFGFRGRIGRKTYWIALATIVGLSLLFIFAIVNSLALLRPWLSPAQQNAVGQGLFGACLLVPILAITTKRLHDINRSGFWIFAFVGLSTAKLLIEDVRRGKVSEFGEVVTILVVGQVVPLFHGLIPFLAAARVGGMGLGIVAQLILLCAGLAFFWFVGLKRGTAGPNSYGPDLGQHASAEKPHIAEPTEGIRTQKRRIQYGAVATAAVVLIGAGGWWGYEQGRLREGRKDGSIKVPETTAQNVPETAAKQAMKSGVVGPYGECRTSIADCSALIDSGRLASSALGEAHAQRAALYEFNGELEQALKDLNAAVKLAPSYARIVKRRGDVHFKLGAKESGIADYQKAYEIGAGDETRAIEEQLKKLGAPVPSSAGPSPGGGGIVIPF